MHYAIFALHSSLQVAAGKAVSATGFLLAHLLQQDNDTAAKVMNVNMWVIHVYGLQCVNNYCSQDSDICFPASLATGAKRMGFPGTERVWCTVTLWKWPVKTWFLILVEILVRVRVIFIKIHHFLSQHYFLSLFFPIKNTLVILKNENRCDIKGTHNGQMCKWQTKKGTEYNAYGMCLCECLCLSEVLLYLLILMMS